MAAIASSSEACAGILSTFRHCLHGIRTCYPDFSEYPRQQPRSHQQPRISSPPRIPQCWTRPSFWLICLTCSRVYLVYLCTLSCGRHYDWTYRVLHKPFFAGFNRDYDRASLKMFGLCNHSRAGLRRDHQSHEDILCGYLMRETR